jgi:hypothetical protein
MKVFEYIDLRGRGVYTEWYLERQKNQRAALDAKLDAVRSAGEPGDTRRGELPPNMFRGPVREGNRSYPNTYKFTVNCDVALRPLACKGPVDEQSEWTILVPVIEVGRKYPPGCFQEAEDRRLEILRDPSRRREILGDDDDDEDSKVRR